MADGEQTPLHRGARPASLKSQGEQQVYEEDSGPSMRQRFLTYITIIARLWAILTIVVLWAAAVVTIKDGYKPLYVGWTLVGISIIVTFLELTWILDKLTCCNRSGCCCACWSVILWVDNWKRGVLYMLMSIPLFLNGTVILLAMLSGFVLVVSGCLYIVKTFRESASSYTRSEIRYVQTSTPVVTVVTHEISTQTEDDKYYAQISHAQNAADKKNPFEEPDQ